MAELFGFKFERIKIVRVVKFTATSNDEAQ